MTTRTAISRLGTRVRSLARRPTRPAPVEFHVPISPNENFFTMVHYLAASLRVLGPPFSSCPIVITVGADCEPFDLAARNPWSFRYPLQWTWVDRGLFRGRGIYATAVERFRRDFRSPAVVMLDADLLIIGSLLEVFEQVKTSPAICGLIAHGSPFLWTNIARSRSNVAWWEELYRRAGLGTPRFVCEHPGWKLLFADESYRFSPPYFNLGVLAAPAEVMHRIGDVVYQEMDHVDDTLDTVFKCQLGLTLSIARLGISWKALQVRFNFPNFPSFWNAFPEAAIDIRVLHYLGGTDGFRKDSDMADVASVRKFLDRDGLPAVNVRLQQALRALQPIVESENPPRSVFSDSR